MEISKITTKQDQFDYTLSDQFPAYAKPGHNTAVETGTIRLEQPFKLFAKYKRMIIDEVDFLPLDDEASKLFFQLISHRYENHSTIITTNKSL